MLEARGVGCLGHPQEERRSDHVQENSERQVSEAKHGARREIVSAGYADKAGARAPQRKNENGHGRERDDAEEKIVIEALRGARWSGLRDADRDADQISAGGFALDPVVWHQVKKKDEAEGGGHRDAKPAEPR